MSEYWVSHKRYHCQYCNIYIADDKPSRQQHENGLRHKGNVERFVRGLYKEGEKKVRDREEEKGIMASVGRAAEAAYAMDVASGRAGSSSSRGPAAVAAPAPKPKPVRATDPYANYTTAASLGYRDPEVEEAERRFDAGTPGAWTVVTSTANGAEGSGSGGSQVKVEDGVGEEGARKRGAPSTETGDEDTREFKLRKKTVGVGLGEIYDPGIIPIKVKGKKKEEEEEKKQEESLEAKVVSGEGESNQPGMRWAKVEWKKASDDAVDAVDVRIEDKVSEAVNEMVEVKVEEKPKVEVITEPMPLFRKRRRAGA